MPRGSKSYAESDAEEAVLLPRQETQPLINLPEGMDPKDYDPDSEESWNTWAQSLHSSQSSGTVRAYKLPTDREGRPINGKVSSQIHLGAWQHDQYSYDELISIITRDFLMPGEVSYIRLMGTRNGKRGVEFNRIIPLQKPASAALPSQGSSQLGEILQAMQTQTRQTMEMMERLSAASQPKVEPPKKSALEYAREISIILAPIVGPAIAAYISRPAPKSDIAQIISAMKDLQGLVGGKDDADENSAVSIVKAVAGPSLQLLTALASRQGGAVVRRRPAGASVAAAQLPSPENKSTVQNPSTEPPHETSTQTPEQLSNATHKEAATSVTVESTPSESDKMIFAQLAPQLDQLAMMAEQGADPKETAKLVLDMLPEEHDEVLADLVLNKEKFDRLYLLSPKAKVQTAWFEALRLALAEEFEKPDEN